MSVLLHKDILTDEQVNLLPLVKSFSNDFGLAGGTAVALYLDHRFSIDFDLFTLKEIDNQKIKRKISKFRKIFRVLKDERDQYTIVVNGVRITFFRYPFKINFSKNFNDIIKISDLLTLAAMKAYALSRRAKWKDYVDLYFIIKRYKGIEKIVKKAQKIFGNEFNEKIFRSQLSYFKDIDYTEKVIYRKGFETNDEIIKSALTDFSLK